MKMSLVDKMKTFFQLVVFIPFIIIGLIASFAFIKAETFDVFLFHPNGVISGEVLDSHRTGTTINERPVIGYDYAFTYEGKEFKGTSYTHKKKFEERQQVEIELAKKDPSKNRIKDTTRGEGGILLSFVLLFPLVGFIGSFFTIKNGFSKIKLIENGVETKARIIALRDTNVSVNKQRVFEFILEFQANGQRIQTKAKKTMHRVPLRMGLNDIRNIVSGVQSGNYQEPSPEMNKGDIVEIIYLPKDPRKIMFKEDLLFYKL